jgi:hypothetical protein
MADEGAAPDMPDTPDTIEGAEGKKSLVKDALNRAVKRVKEAVDKNALLAAILNAMFWGLGYFYNGGRRAFALMLMSTELLIMTWLYLNPDPRSWRFLGEPLIVFAGVLFSLALAYDAYRDAIAEEKAREKAQMES